MEHAYRFTIIFNITLFFVQAISFSTVNFLSYNYHSLFDQLFRVTQNISAISILISSYIFFNMSNYSFESCIRRLSQKATKVFLKLKFMSKRDPKVVIAGFDHCSSTPLASMELSSQLKQVFKLIDTNGDGKISSLELSQVLMCLGQKRTAANKEADIMVRELDRNGDGYIDFEEFVDALGVNTAQLSLSDKEDELMDAFAIFDSDNNGFISANELHRILAGLGYEKCSLKECFKMIKGVDQDGDGLINFEEFKIMMTTYTA